MTAVKANRSNLPTPENEAVMRTISILFVFCFLAVCTATVSAGDCHGKRCTRERSSESHQVITKTRDRVREVTEGERTRERSRSVNRDRSSKKSGRVRRCRRC